MASRARAGLVPAMLGAALSVVVQGAVGQGAVDKAVQGVWRIEQARVEPVYDRTRARLHFAADGQLSGHGGCNPIQARYSLQGDRLALSQLTSGHARCAPLQMEQEDRILSALEAVATARVRDDGLLELRDADGRGVLRATRLQTGAD